MSEAEEYRQHWQGASTRHRWMKIALRIVLCALPFALALPASAADRACSGDERVEVAGKIRDIWRSKDGITVIDTEWEEPATGTCRVRTVLYRAEKPPKCVNGAKFMAAGTTLKHMPERMVAERLTCG